MGWLNRLLRISRLLRGSREPVTPIAELVEGEPARIVGVAGAQGPLLTTPVSAQPCIGFRLHIERRPVTGPGETWESVLLRQDCQSFSVRDDSGLAIVERPVILRIDVDVGGWAGLPPEVYELLEEEQIPTSDRFRDYEFRFGMGVLKPGDRVSVEGQATWQLDPSVPAPNARALPEAWHFKDTEVWPLVVRDIEDPAA
jgi:hypothetical protein